MLRFNSNKIRAVAFAILVGFLTTSHAFVGPQRVLVTRYPVSAVPTVSSSPSLVTKTSTRLYDTAPPQAQEKQSANAINWGLIGQNAANQALIGSTIWTGGPGFQTLVNDAHFGPLAVISAIIGVLPMLFVSRQIETSESYLVSGLNLSTNMAVLRLFGSQPRPVSALAISAFLATLTGIVEEVTFRGQMIPFLANRVGDGDILTGAILSTLLFAFLHTNPLSFFKGGEAFLDNAVLLGLQIFNGGFFALLYLATGNLAVPIMVHALYDLYTFYKTHMVDVAGQISYAQQQQKWQISPAVEQRWIRERGEDFVKGVKQTFYLMDTDQDGELSRKELRVALYSYGVNLSAQQSAQVAQSADLDQSGAIDVEEFLEFVGPSGSTSKAVRNTLFGPL